MGEGQHGEQNFAEFAASEAAANDFKESYRGNVDQATYMRNGYTGGELVTLEDAVEDLERCLNNEEIADIATDPESLSIYTKNFDEYSPAQLKAAGCTLNKIADGDPQGIRKIIDEMYRSGHAVFFAKDTDGTLIIAEHNDPRRSVERQLQN